MSSGLVVFDGNSAAFTVGSNRAVDFQRSFYPSGPGMDTTSCDSDPVVVGTSCRMLYSGMALSYGSHTVTYIDASALGVAPFWATVSSAPVSGSLVMPPFDLSADDGALLASAIVAVWAVGWAFRVVIRAFNVDTDAAASGG